MCQNPTSDPSKETPRQCPNKHIQRHTLTRTQFLLRKSRNIEVRHDVAEEIAECAQCEEEEELVFHRGFIEESASFAWAREDGASREECGEGEESAAEGDEADCADGPREANFVDELVEHYDVDYSTYSRY